MNIVAGASGQVGSAIVKELKNKNVQVRAVVRNANRVTDKDLDLRIADFLSSDQLINSFDGGTTVFLLTPENPASNDIIAETRQITENYKKAIHAAGIRKIVGLSSIGAHVRGNTGQIQMSGILEGAFDDMAAEKIFIRPSYYYSNWMGYLETIQQSGILPTFFPVDLKIAMNSPLDVAEFIADLIANSGTSADKKIIELAGPEKYSSFEVAEVFSRVLGRNVEAQTIPESKWKETLVSAGFSENTSSNLADMSQSLIDGLLIPEREDNLKVLPTTLYEYLKERLKKQ